MAASDPIQTFQLTLSGVAQPLSTTAIYTQSFAIRNLATNDTIYVGSSTVSPTTGMPIYVNETNEKSTRTGARGVPMQFDLSKVYVIGTAADIIAIEYLLRDS